jgi:tetraprenyl-beta-curcumene synthase
MESSIRDASWPASDAIVIGDITFALRSVMRSPQRLRALVAEDPLLPVDLVRFLLRVVPVAAESLASIRADAERIPDAQLRTEALASVDGKAFHVAGASILATFLPNAEARQFIQIVTPLETIYDYLDNLCDRHPDVSADAYPVLHRAIADALNPYATPHDYYAKGPAGDDGGYLRSLVAQTQQLLAPVPSIEVLQPCFADAAAFYADLQTYKHLPRGERELACVAWYERNRPRFGMLDWHEFACAAGSNMHVFAALYTAFARRPDAIRQTYDAYFPFVSAIHILLDSFIDQEEDAEHDDLNFARPYGSAAALRERFAFMTSEARMRLSALPHSGRHRFVLDVMTLFYLSHPKVAAAGLEREAQRLLRANGAR